MEPLVTQHWKWRHLIKALAARPGLYNLSMLDFDEARYALAGPAVVARWIATQCPQLLDKTELRLLLWTGAPWTFTDYGAWFRLIPALLGNSSMSVVVEIPTDVPFDKAPHQLGAAQVSTFLRPAARERSLAQCLSKDSRTPDLIAMLHPAFLYGDASINPLPAVHGAIGRGAAVMLATSALLETRFECAIMEAAGIVCSEGDSNPFAVEQDALQSEEAEHERPLLYGRISGVTGIKPPCNDLQQRQVRRHTKRAAGIAAAAVLGFEHLPLERVDLFATDLPLGNSLGEDDTFFYLGSDHLVRRLDKRVYRLQDGFASPLPLGLPPAFARSFPTPDAPWYTRMRWAVGVFHAFVRPYLDTLLLPNVSSESMAQAMQHLHEMMEDSNPAFRGMGEKLTQMVLGKPRQPIAPDAWPLFRAVVTQDREHIMALIEQKPALIHAVDDDGQTLVFHACHWHDADLLRLCLSKGARVGHRDREGFTPLLSAINDRYVEAIPLLIAAGSDIEAERGPGWRPLSSAASSGCWDIVEILVDAGAQLDAPRPPTGETSVRGFLQQVQGDLPKSLVRKLRF